MATHFQPQRKAFFNSLAAHVREKIVGSGLIEEQWVNPRSPLDSRFVTELLGFRGPMYKVFNTLEMDVILDWIGSLAGAPAPPPPSIAEKVYSVLDRYMARAANVKAHRRLKLPDASGTLHMLVDWCAKGDIDALMGALAASEYVVSGDPAVSRLIGEVFEGEMDNVLDPGEIDVFRDWIKEGCPQRSRVQGETTGFLRTVSVAEVIDRSRERSFALRRMIVGAGAVH